MVDEAKGDDEEDEASPDLVAGVQLAYSKRKPERKVVRVSMLAPCKPFQDKMKHRGIST